MPRVASHLPTRDLSAASDRRQISNFPHEPEDHDEACLVLLLSLVAATSASVAGGQARAEHQPPSPPKLEIAVPGAPPALEIMPVFEPARLGYDTTRIPAMLRTSTETLLAFCEAAKARRRLAQIDILARRSRDGDRAWSDVALARFSLGG